MEYVLNLVQGMYKDFHWLLLYSGFYIAYVGKLTYFILSPNHVFSQILSDEYHAIS